MRQLMLRVPDGVAEAPLTENDVCLRKTRLTVIHIMNLMSVPLIDEDPIARIGLEAFHKHTDELQVVTGEEDRRLLHLPNGIV